MPCRYDPTPEEIEEGNKAARERKTRAKMRGDLNRLTHENDQLRECIIKLLDDGHQVNLPQDLLDSILADQVKHRKEDLERLGRTFIKAKDTERLGKVWEADPAKPLAPQLGFDPDEF